MASEEEEDDETDAAASQERSSPRYQTVDPAPPPGAAAAVHELREARALLNLDHFSLDELVEVVVEAAPRGGLSAEAFAKVCRRLATLGGNGRGDQETRNAAARLSRRIFAAFDAQETDDVDFVEVAAGLGVLAPASMDDKIEAAFALYDVTRGGVAFEELRGYLLAVYRVLRACSASLALRIHQAGGPLKLADDTAAACFRSRRLGDDAPLDVQLFKEFVCEGISAAYERHPFSPPSPEYPLFPYLGPPPATEHSFPLSGRTAARRGGSGSGMGTSTQVVAGRMTILDFRAPEAPSVPSPLLGPWLPRRTACRRCGCTCTPGRATRKPDHAICRRVIQNCLYSTDSARRGDLAMTTKHPCRSKPVMLRGPPFCSRAGAAQPCLAGRRCQ